MNNEIYHFPNYSTGGLFLYNTSNSRVSFGAILPPAKVEINLEMSDDELFKTYCAKCPAYISPSTVNSSLRKKVLEKKKEEPNYDQMQKLINDFYLKTNKCRGVYADACKFDYFNNRLVTLNTPELTLLKRTSSLNFESPSDGYWRLLFQKTPSTDELNKYYPYCIGNVYYDDGSICWGSNIETPFDHAQAAQDFFGSSFNNDLQLSVFWFGEYNDNYCECSTNCDCEDDDDCECSPDCDCDDKIYSKQSKSQTYHEWFDSGYRQHIYGCPVNFTEDYKYYREDAKGLILFKESSANNNFMTDSLCASFAWIVDEDDYYYLLEMPNTRHSNYTKPQVLLYHKETGLLAMLEKSKESIK